MGIKFDGKQLLLLGSNVGSIDIIKYARHHGCYTIVADNLPIEKSSAKMEANEALLISTEDVDRLVEVVKARRIDAVMAGVSEFNLLNAMAVSEKCGLRFYCNRVKWNHISQKDKFRQLCISHGVPCPRTFFIGTSIPKEVWDLIEYPVVVKPVDGSSSAGVHICFNEEDLKIGLFDSFNMSKKGSVIIEEYIQGNEFTAHYTIKAGRITLSCMDNYYPVKVHEGNVTTIPVARIYPSVYIRQYMKKVDPAMISLCKELQLNYGVLFIQGFYNPVKDQFWIFEGGLRSGAELPNRLLSNINGVDYLKMLVDYALLGESTFVSEKENPFLHGKCCGVISFVSKGGKVGKIIGLEEAVSLTPSVVEYENRYPVGSEIPNTDTLRQLMIRFVMICDSREQLASDVEYLNKHIQVFDESGNNMVIHIEPSRILDELKYHRGNERFS